MISLLTVALMRLRWNKLDDHETREKRRDGAISVSASRNLMIREKKHFPSRTLLRRVSGSLSLHTFTEYLQNRYRGFSYDRRDVLDSIRPTDRFPTRRCRGDTLAARIKFLWTKCLHRTPLYTGVVPLLMAPFTRSKILAVANNASPVLLLAR